MRAVKAEVGNVKTDVDLLKAEAAKTESWRQNFDTKMDTL